MKLEDYQEFHKQIMCAHSRERAYAMYVKLMEVFVQDCSLAGEKYFGNNVIAKAQILNNLQPYFWIERK